MIKGDCAAFGFRQPDRVRRGPNFRFDFQKLGQALGSTCRQGQFPPDFGKCCKRSCSQNGIEQELA